MKLKVHFRAVVLIAGTAGLLAAGVMAASPAFARNTTTNANEPMWHVGLNPSSPNGGCSYDPTTLGPSAKAGEAVFHVDGNAGTTILDVSILGGVPNTSYDVDIRCTVPYPIGHIATDSYGNGQAEITLPGSLATYVWNNSFYVDSAINPSTPPCPCSGAGYYGDTFISTQFAPLNSD